MILAIDIGNSNVVLGFYQDRSWQKVWRMPTRTEQDAHLFYHMRLGNQLFEEKIESEQISRTIISSVVPELTDTFVELISKLFPGEPILVEPSIYPKLEMDMLNPHEIGTDLLANAVAAHHLYQKDCIIVDFGTALTFTVVDINGDIIGVSIAPGLKTALSSLYSKTAKLPEVPVAYPNSVVGKNTAHAIQSGVLIGYVGLVKHMIQEIRNEVGQQYIAVATGGLASVIPPLQTEFDAFNPHLTLDGLRIIDELANA